MTETINYNSIKTQHGVNVLQQVKKLETISKRTGRFASHLRFYLQCKHTDLKPKGIKLRTTVEIIFGLIRS